MVSDFLSSGDIVLRFSFDCLGLVNLFKNTHYFPSSGTIIPFSFWNICINHLRTFWGYQSSEHGRAITREYSQLLGPQVVLQIFLLFLTLWKLQGNGYLHGIYLYEKPEQQ